MAKTPPIHIFSNLTTNYKPLPVDERALGREVRSHWIKSTLRTSPSLKTIAQSPPWQRVASSKAISSTHQFAAIIKVGGYITLFF